MIKIICVGKLKEKYLKDAESEYLKRLTKYTKINLIELKDSNINDEKEGDNNGYALDDESDEKYDEAVAIVLKN